MKLAPQSNSQKNHLQLQFGSAFQRNRDLVEVQVPHNQREAKKFATSILNQRSKWQNNQTNPQGTLGMSTALNGTQSQSPRLTRNRNHTSTIKNPFQERKAENSHRAKKTHREDPSVVQRSPSGSQHHQDAFTSQTKQYGLKQQNITFQITQQMQRQQLSQYCVVPGSLGTSNTNGSGIGNHKNKQQSNTMTTVTPNLGEAKRNFDINRLGNILKPNGNLDKYGNLAYPEKGSKGTEDGTLLDQNSASFDAKKSSRPFITQTFGSMDSLRRFGPDAVKMKLSQKQARQGSKEKSFEQGIEQSGKNQINDKVLNLNKQSRPSSASQDSAGPTSQLGSKAQYLHSQDAQMHQSVSQTQLLDDTTRIADNTPDHHTRDKNRTGTVIGEVDSVGNSFASYVRRQDKDLQIIGSSIQTPPKQTAKKPEPHQKIIEKKQQDHKKVKGQREPLHMKNAELLLESGSAETGFLNNENHVDSAIFGAPSIQDHPNQLAMQSSMQMNPVMKTQIIRHSPKNQATQSLSISPHNSQGAFSASRNKTINSKNKNYQPWEVTMKMRESLQQSNSGRSFSNTEKQYQIVLQTAANLANGQLHNMRDEDISKLLRHYNIKPTSNMINQTPYDPDYSPLVQHYKGNQFPGRSRNNSKDKNDSQFHFQGSASAQMIEIQASAKNQQDQKSNPHKQSFQFSPNNQRNQSIVKDHFQNQTSSIDDHKQSPGMESLKLKQNQDSSELSESIGGVTQ